MEILNFGKFEVDLKYFIYYLIDLFHTDLDKNIIYSKEYDIINCTTTFNYINFLEEINNNNCNNKLYYIYENEMNKFFQLKIIIYHGKKMHTSHTCTYGIADNYFYLGKELYEELLLKSYKKLSFSNHDIFIENFMIYRNNFIFNEKLLNFSAESII